MKRLFLTGHEGFVGQTLRSWLAAAPASAPEIELVPPRSRYDLTDPASLECALPADAFDFVIHLAAQSFVPESFRDPKRTYDVNFTGTLNLFQALKTRGFTGRVLYVSSAEVYGQVPPEQMPIDESRAPQPRSPYGVSKVAAEALCGQWSRTAGLDVVVVRPFNHIGPGQTDRFVVASFTRQVAEIKLGQRPPVIEIGDVEVTRDFTDARDVVEAYLRLLEDGAGGETYNVCSGREVWVRDLLPMLFELAGVEARVAQDPARLRPAEQKRLLGSYEKLQRATSWAPTTPLRTSLADALAWWEHKLSRG
ncbi:MAG TPA: GDP-mannose 4,6-dehydratase [Burkholderiales bacterium]|nr:GDP-mannose 4,6-dehydratase [Burkholderiales bacterium]